MPDHYQILKVDGGVGAKTHWTLRASDSDYMDTGVVDLNEDGEPCTDLRGLQVFLVKCYRDREDFNEEMLLDLLEQARRTVEGDWDTSWIVTP